jgi:hypothetical protein
MNKRDALVRAQRIATDVNDDMPDAEPADNYAEYVRRVYDPSYIPRSHNYGGAA